MLSIKKKSTAPIPQSPPPDISQASKNKSQKKSKDLESKITNHIKRVVDGITSKIDKGSIDKIISDTETVEGCCFIMKILMIEVDQYFQNDMHIFKTLEVLYILLQTSNSTFRIAAQQFMPEIITITTFNFKKSKVKYRDCIHNLAKAIYLNLQCNRPLPSPSQLGLAEQLASFIPINIDRNIVRANYNEKQISSDYGITKIDIAKDCAQNKKDDSSIAFMNDAPEQKNRINLDDTTSNNISFDDISDTKDTIKKNVFDDDLIDCNSTDDIIANNSKNHSIDAKSINDDNSAISISDSRKYTSSAKQVLDDYLKKNGELSDEVVNHSSEINKSFDNLLLILDESFPTSSNFYSSTKITNDNNNQNNKLDDPSNIFNNNKNSEMDSVFDNESNSKKSLSKRQPKKFIISSEKSEMSSSINIPRSQSLGLKLPMINESNKDLNHDSNGQGSNLSVLIDPNQIIDLTKPSSTPNSPPGSMMDANQNSYLDSILNSAPINTSSHQPSVFNPPSSFESPETSNYNSDSSSNNLNSNRYMTQLSKSNLTLNTSSNFASNIALNLEPSPNSVSDSILKIPSSQTSDIPILNPKYSLNDVKAPLNTLQINENKDNNDTIKNDSNNNNNSEASLNKESDQSNSFHFNVEYKPSQTDEIPNSPRSQPKKNFRIEKKSKLPRKHYSFSISQIERPNKFPQNQDNLYESIKDRFNSNPSNNDFSISNSNIFSTSNQELYTSSIPNNTNDDENFAFENKPSVGLDDFDNRFEPITPTQSGNIKMCDGNSPQASSIVVPSGTNTSQNNGVLLSPATPVRTPIKSRKSSSLSDSGFEPISSQNSNLEPLNINESANKRSFNNFSSSDDQFVPITPVKSEGNIGISKYNSLTPTKEDETYEDQFEPITPVKNLIDNFDDSDTNNSNINQKSSNNNHNSSGSGMFVPISPVFHDLQYGSDDQFIPMSPTPDNLKKISDEPIPQLDINKNSLTYNLNNLTPRSRRHFSFDSGAQCNGSDKFEPITPPNARSMFALNCPSYKPTIDITDDIVSKTESGNEMVNKIDFKSNDNSFSDLFEPITPPSSLQKRSHIQDLLASNTEQMIPNQKIFDQNNKIESKFNENLDKQINKNDDHFVTFEISQNHQNESNINNNDQFSNFEPIDPLENDSKTNNDSFDPISDSSSEAAPNQMNIIDLRPVVPNNNNNNSKRFSIKRTPSPQTIDENINN